MIRFDIQFVQYREQEIRHRGVFRIPDVASTFDAARSTARKQHRQRRVIVLIAVAHGAAVEDDGMVKEGSIAIRRVLQFVEQVSEYASVVAI